MNTKKHTGAKIIDDASFKFVLQVDNITIGVTVDGYPIDTGRVEWPLEDKIRWAGLNAAFYDKLSKNIALYTEALIKQQEKEKTNELQRS